MRVVVLPGAAITVVEDCVSVVERPTKRVSIDIATSPPTPTTTESLLGRWPELGRHTSNLRIMNSSIDDELLTSPKPSKDGI
jgi:hypothetical protein